VALIADAATSSLDAASEKKVQAAIELLLQARKGGIATPRLSTICGAQHLSVFKDGKIVVTGDHKSLGEKGGASSQLVKRQLPKDEG
jgi:ABC-type transport system involved in Fe-S cluster assembly fused permease/ATPase subunit